MFQHPQVTNASRVRQGFLRLTKIRVSGVGSGGACQRLDFAHLRRIFRWQMPWPIRGNSFTALRLRLSFALLLSSSGRPPVPASEVAPKRHVYTEHQKRECVPRRTVSQCPRESSDTGLQTLVHLPNGPRVGLGLICPQHISTFTVGLSFPFFDFVSARAHAVLPASKKASSIFGATVALDLKQAIIFLAGSSHLSCK